MVIAVASFAALQSSIKGVTRAYRRLLRFAAIPHLQPVDARTISPPARPETYQEPAVSARFPQSSPPRTIDSELRSNTSVRGTSAAGAWGNFSRREISSVDDDANEIETMRDAESVRGVGEGAGWVQVQGVWVSRQGWRGRSCLWAEPSLMWGKLSGN